MVGADRRGRVIEILKYHHISKGNNYDLKFTTQNVTQGMLFRKKNPVLIIYVIRQLPDMLFLTKWC